MQTDETLVVNLAGPDWADDLPALISDLVDKPPKAIRFTAGPTINPTAEEAQILLMLTRHAAEEGIELDLTDVDPTLPQTLSRIGFAPVFTAKGDAQP